jgi:hypothetical protein
MISSWLADVRVAALHPMQLLGSTSLRVGADAAFGRALCRPVSAPAQVSQQRWGVSDPAFASQTSPRGRQRGRSVPGVGVGDVLGHGVDDSEFGATTRALTRFAPTSAQQSGGRF